MAYIYQIKNKETGKIYIGSTKDIRKRWSQHKSKLRRGCHSNSYLQNAWNKYGEDAFEFSVLKKVPTNQQFIEEQRYLDKKKPFGKRGYNLSKSAAGQPVERKSLNGICECCGEEFTGLSNCRRVCDRCAKMSKHIEGGIEELKFNFPFYAIDQTTKELKAMYRMSFDGQCRTLDEFLDKYMGFGR